MEPITSLLVGGLMRLVPLWFEGKKASTEADHEFRMAELQLRVAVTQAEAKQGEYRALKDYATETMSWQSLTEAIKAQSKPTGIRWVDAANALVRPAVTYWLVGLYCAHRIAAIASGGEVFTSFDGDLLAYVLAFWFADRTIVKSRLGIQ